MCVCVCKLLEKQCNENFSISLKQRAKCTLFPIIQWKNVFKFLLPSGQKDNQQTLFIFSTMAENLFLRVYHPGNREHPQLPSIGQETSGWSNLNSDPNLHHAGTLNTTYFNASRASTGRKLFVNSCQSLHGED